MLFLPKGTAFKGFLRDVGDLNFCWNKLHFHTDELFTHGYEFRTTALAAMFLLGKSE